MQQYHGHGEDKIYAFENEDIEPKLESDSASNENVYGSTNTFYTSNLPYKVPNVYV